MKIPRKIFSRAMDMLWALVGVVLVVGALTSPATPNVPLGIEAFSRITVFMVGTLCIMCAFPKKQ